MTPVRIAVIGAGLIGRKHIGHVLAEDCAELAAIVDPDAAAEALAREAGVPWHPTLAALLAADRPDGVIIATPNQLHVSQGLEAIACGVPALVEKPLADDVAGAERLVDAAERAGVPLMTGHHRRHNPLIRAAAHAVAEGRLGRIAAVQATSWFYKPDHYFEATWRRSLGAGPVLINLIHDVDLLRLFCGDVASVHAIESHAVRGFEVEDTAAVLLRFTSGALGTMTLSDTIQAPWSWEFTAGDNPAYTHTHESCILIGGTKGSLSIPRLDVWHHPSAPDWWQPLISAKIEYAPHDPLALQVRNLCAVIRGTEAPVVSGREGLATLRVIDAIKRSAAGGGSVDL